MDELGLEAAISALLRDMCADAGVECSPKIELGDTPLPSEVEIGLYRIAQESLTNILRHAQATHIRLELVQTPYSVCMVIEDNGAGFDAEKLATSGRRGMGLLSMQQRTELLRGSFDVYSSLGEGTLVQVRIPVLEEAKYAQEEN